MTETPTVVLAEVVRNRRYEGGGWTLAREYETRLPNEEPFAGRWALRDAAGHLVDHDQYRNDLAARRSLTLNPTS